MTYEMALLGGMLIGYGLLSRLTNFVFRRLVPGHFLFWSHATAFVVAFVLAGFGFANGTGFSLTTAAMYGLPALLFVGIDYWWSVLEKAENDRAA